MSEHIIKEFGETWNTRVDQRMKTLGLTQRKFIEKYKKVYGTGSQADVSKWIHVGEIDGRSEKPRNFPDFVTMKKIANILGVSVGYLIGETDYETFELERTCKYTGLDSSAITEICNITSGRAIPPFYKYPDPQITGALNLLLSTPVLFDYLKQICELAQCIDSEKNPKEFFDEALERIPKKLRDDIVALWADPEDAIENHGVEGSEENWAYARMLDEAAVCDMEQPDLTKRDVNASKYSLAEIHMKMIDDIMQSEDFRQLLPKYATKEDIEKMIQRNEDVINTD